MQYLRRPTAVEAIKNAKTGKVEKLYLHGSENEVLGDWLELHDLIRTGDCVALATYAKQHRIDLQTVRFTVSITISSTILIDTCLHAH